MKLKTIVVIIEKKQITIYKILYVLKSKCVFLNLYTLKTDKVINKIVK